jgi:NAD(P)-dependent dehydrogenase (short-subunit alcohol dehydrogenase family)
MKIGLGLFQLPYHFNRTGVRVLAMCPGATNTNLISEAPHRQLFREWGEECGREIASFSKQK